MSVSTQVDRSDQEYAHATHKHSVDAKAKNYMDVPF